MSAAINAHNLEEAATIASEFVSSLDNLPSEVQHLLQEIRHKEARTLELQHEIGKDSSRYIRHSLRGSMGSPTSMTDNNNNNKGHVPAKIASAYAEIEELAGEKMELAERIVTLIGRMRRRLDIDLGRVGVLQGEPGVETQQHQHLQQQQQQLIEEVVAVEVAVVVPKKRRASPVVKRAITREVSEEGSSEEGEDKSIYCFCRKMSYGEMIACDNEDCEYQWFHVGCVNVVEPIPESWYCSACVGNRSGRKGRKKGV